MTNSPDQSANTVAIQPAVDGETLRAELCTDKRLLCSPRSTASCDRAAGCSSPTSPTDGPSRPRRYRTSTCGPVELLAGCTVGGRQDSQGSGFVDVVIGEPVDTFAGAGGERNSRAYEVYGITVPGLVEREAYRCRHDFETPPSAYDDHASAAVRDYRLALCSCTLRLTSSWTRSALMAMAATE